MSGIRIYRGDSKDLLVSVAHEDKSPYDLTGMQVVLTVKTDIDSDSPLIQKVGVPSQAGEVIVKITPEDSQVDPGVYPYDIELSNTDRSYVATLVLGNLTISADVGQGVK